jgi:putative peptide zinc metalloprotease protein
MKSIDYRRSTAERTLPLRMRGDLQVVEVAFSGDATYVVKDSVAGEAFHLTAEEHALLDALRKPTSLRDLQRTLETRFAPRRATIGELQQFVNRLYDLGLLLSENAGQGAELLDRGRERRRKERRWNWLQVLSIRLGSMEAGRLIDRLYAMLGWACSRPAVLAACGLIAFSLLLAIGNASELSARMPALRELMRPGLLPLWIVAMAGVKVLHELGHAMACRHFGARPQEIGVIILAGAPSLYCDVSDAWRLPSKWQRMAVSSAGMFVELVIASIAVLAWRYAEPGLLSTVCVSLIVVCSIGTVLVNANPLLRYDGYYLLADGLEVPNLAERARGLVGGAWQRWLLGVPREEDPLLGPHKRRALWVYAILAKVYLALVLVGVFVLLLKLARPNGLQNLVYTLAAIALAGLLWRPAISTGKLLANPAVRSRFRWMRLCVAVLVLAALTAAMFFLPITRRVPAPLVIVPEKFHPLFAVTAGELEFAVAAGDSVKRGEVVARLRNEALELALSEQQGSVREFRTRLEQLRTLQTSLPAAARLIPTATAELSDAEAQLAEHKSMIESLEIRSPADGRVFAPPDRLVEERDVGTLRAWRGSPLETRNNRAWIEAGTPLAIVAEDGGGWKAWAGVEQADVPAVQAGQAARILLDQQPMKVFHGTVVEVARRAKSNQAPLAVHVERNDSLGEEAYHVVQIALESPPATVLPGARGLVKIATYDSTVGRLVLDELRRTFQRVF